MKHPFRTLFVALSACFALLYSAPAQQLIPLASFGTNGDGTIRPGDYPFLTSDGSRLQRGMAYNPATGHLIIVNRNPIGSETINIIDAFTGAEVGQLDQSAKTLGGSASFTYNMVAVAEDGAIYVCNLSTSGTFVEFIVYRWANEGGPQVRVYGPANPGNTTVGGSRWGDTLAVRGAGINTEILAATQNGTLAAILKPNDGSMTAFSATTLNTDVPSGAIGYGLTFGTNNTFYGRAASAGGEAMYRLSYDLGAGTATTLQVYSRDAFPGRVGPIMAQTANNLLAALEITESTAPDVVRLYDISNPANAPVFLDRKAVAVMTNLNAVYAGAVAFGATNVYALNADNGLVAYTITGGVAVNPVQIFAQPQSRVVPATSNVVFSVGVDGTPLLSYQWWSNSAAMPYATNATLLLTNVQPASGGNYWVVATNDYAAVTSSVAILTVLESYGNLLAYDPFNYAIDSLLDKQGGWVTNTGTSYKIEAGNLDIPYLAPSIGNHVLMNNINTSMRMPIGSYTKGVLYFSFALRLENYTGTGSETMAALSVGSTTSYNPKINITGDGAGHYTIGVYKGTGTANGALATNALGNTLLFTSSDTVFVVGRYQFNSGTSDDTCDMWINPDPATFGAVTAPPPTVGPIGAGVTDMATIDRFVFRYNQTGYSRRHVDEMRVGFAWSEVTPPAKPTLDIAQAGASVKLLWPTNISSGYVLESLKGLGDPDGWQPVGTPVVEGVSNTATVSATGTRLFRLKK